MNEQPKSGASPGGPEQVPRGESGNPATAFAPGQRGAESPPVAEQELWSGRAHWHSSIGRVVLWLFINVGIIVAAIYMPRSEWLPTSRVAWAAFVFIILNSLVILGGVFIPILQTRYRLTTQRLFIERGILSRTMDQTELIRVDDVRMEQSFVNRIFGIGNVTMLTTDVTDRSVAIIGIKEPIRVTELIRQQMRTLRGKSVFIETL